MRITPSEAERLLTRAGLELNEVNLSSVQTMGYKSAEEIDAKGGHITLTHLVWVPSIKEASK